MHFFIINYNTSKPLENEYNHLKYKILVISYHKIKLQIIKITLFSFFMFIRQFVCSKV